MQVEVGSIVEGKVTGLTNFGAFVELPDGKTGMVHISEVAAAYVKEIRDYIQENQMVKVKVLAVTPEGKISLSIKQADPNAAQQAAGSRPPRSGSTGPRPGGSSSGPRQGGGSGAPRQGGGGSRGRGPRNVGWRGPKPTEEPATFEDMLSRFKQTSDDKQSDLRRNMDGKRGSSGGRRGGGSSR